MNERTTGQRIAECRKALALSQEGLGEKLGVSRQAISKWEADAAMPDIDKLIALSKLFSVSVGWLLGVEELAQQESPQVSEELLHSIETVVRQYQPKKKFPVWKALLAAVLAIALIWGGVRVTREWRGVQSRLSQLSSQVNNNDNSRVISRLDSLENRIDDLIGGPEHFSIASTNFYITPDTASMQASVQVSVIPGNWYHEYDASISVRRNGEQVLSQACAWDDNALNSRFLLPLENGYEYWLVVKYADGTQEQAQLSSVEARNLKSSFIIDCSIAHGTARFDLDKSTMELLQYELSIAPPYTNNGRDVHWTLADLVLYHVRDENRETADTHQLLRPNSDEPGVQSHSITFFPNGPFRIPQVQEGDRFELIFYVAMENGITLEETVDCWTYTGGEFVRGN